VILLSYTALYRKFRPSTFKEIVGQEHITQTLKNQIIVGRVGHAYLLNGGRGTGKTSAAKVLARAINCLNPMNGEPCNECDICKSALNGSLTDIVEMDAASNNSVEDIRSIREEVNFLPTVAKYRVYIIDEVHMLSTGAFNALLKTLEEPPAHVKFILATTEPQKLPATILSRCQRFDFKKISDENIAKRLKYVCDESNIEINPEALKLIAVLSEGAMRDALSILERCVQDGESQINEEKVRELVGIPKLTYINQLVNCIINNNIEEALEVIDNIINEGKDLQNFLWEIIKYVKNILVYKASKNAGVYTTEEIKNIEKIAEAVTKEKLLSIIYSLSNLENDMKYSSQKTILFQVAIIKLCMQEVIVTPQSNCNVGANELSQLANLQNRVKNLEMQISQGNYKTNKNINSQAVSKPEVKKEDTKKNVKQIQAGETIDSWSKIVNELKDSGKIMLYTNLINSKASQINDMIVGIEFPNGLTPFAKTVLEKNENITELEKRLSIELGKTMKVRYLDNKENVYEVKQNANPIETFANDMDIPFNVYE